MEWDLSAALISLAVVFSGASLQAVTGLGAGLIIVPLLALLSYQLVPGPMIFASIALSALMTLRGWYAVEWSSVRVVMPGLLLGTVLATLVLAGVPFKQLGIVFALMIFLGIGISLWLPPFRLKATGLTMVGTLSGVMGTSAGIGAPVLALAYQHHQPEVIRATLATLYLFSSIIMLVGLHFIGRFGAEELQSGLYLIPGFVLGYLFSSRWVDLINQNKARWAVIVVSAGSAGVLLLKGLALV